MSALSELYDQAISYVVAVPHPDLKPFLVLRYVCLGRGGIEFLFNLQPWLVLGISIPRGKYSQGQAPCSISAHATTLQARRKLLENRQAVSSLSLRKLLITQSILIQAEKSLPISTSNFEGDEFCFRAAVVCQDRETS